VAGRTVTVDIKGGEKLTRLLKKMTRGVQTATGVNVGILRDAQYPAAYKNRVEYRISPMRTTTSVAQVAFWNEFGTKWAPARPFMRTTITEKSPKWGDSLAYVLKASGYDAKRAFTSMGQGIQGQIKQTISNWSDPANAKRTVEIKGFNKPLTDEGFLHQNINYEVLTR
jgi:hypothetical protein